MIPNLDLGCTRLILEVAAQEKCYLEEKAYILATALWETNQTMEPVEEAYFLGEERAERYRRNLSYYPWHGRGFVQLTHERNYKRMSKRLGLDLTSDPSVVMQPEISARILVVGSREGLFSGKRLSAFLSPGNPDYVNARRVINGTDCARRIADIALQYENVLQDIPSYPYIRRGSKGASVSALQAYFAALGHVITVDGMFGPRTEAFVKAFQRANGLVPDGIVGPKTWAIITPDTGENKGDSA